MANSVGLVNRFFPLVLYAHGYVGSSVAVMIHSTEAAKRRRSSTTGQIT